jgi:transposase
MTAEKDQRIKDLEDEVALLQREKDKITQEKEKIAREFKEFKATHAVTVDNLKKAMKIKPNSRIKPKPSGAPLNHKAYTRHIPARIDYIKSHIPNKCPHCNSKLQGKAKAKRSRYITDIKLTTQPKTTQHDIYRKYCSTCKKYVEPKITEALPRANLGINLMLLIMYLKLGLRIPCEKICDFLLTCYDVKLSKGGVIGVLKQLAREFGDYYAHLEKIVKIARVKHTDSTSWRIAGKNYFAWVFIAIGVVLYKIRKRNNSRVPISVFGRNQKGNTLVIDRHSALRALAKKAGFLLQLCWSHILDDSKQLAKSFGAEGKYVHRKLKEIYALAKAVRHEGTTEHVEQLKAEIFQLTGRHYKSLTVWKFVKNLYYRDGEHLFRFVTDPDVDPTNNISERELRALVIIRKISFGSGSPRGAAATAMLLSVVQTLRLNKKNVLLGLQDILNNPVQS